VAAAIDTCGTSAAYESLNIKDNTYVTIKKNFPIFHPPSNEKDI
jgi:hypothetical protein